MSSNEFVHTEPRVVGRNADSWASWEDALAEYQKYLTLLYETNNRANRILTSAPSGGFCPRAYGAAMSAVDIAQSNCSAVRLGLFARALGEWSDESARIRAQREATIARKSLADTMGAVMAVRGIPTPEWPSVRRAIVESCGWDFDEYEAALDAAVLAGAERLGILPRWR